jgi:hypothetical protein
MGLEATACAPRVKAARQGWRYFFCSTEVKKWQRSPRCHHSSQFFAGPPFCLPPKGAALARCSRMDRYRSMLMKLKTLLAERSEQITNWLALLVLLALGVVG